MDLKVYTKETVKQPNGSTEYIITPNVIDIIPTYDLEENNLLNAEIVTTENEIIQQACALATIWQKGLDPLDREIGVRWSEALLGEINVVQLMEDITNAVAQITPTMTVVFDTVVDENGNSYLKYTLKGVA